MGPETPTLSCGLQAFGLRATWGAPYQVRQHVLGWRGELQPSPYSRTYLVKVRYRLGHHPEVSVCDPTLDPNDEGWLPHYYHRNDTLCLYDQGEWNPGMYLAWTIMPWTVEWLFHYEIWKATGVWHGSGDDMVWANVTPLPDLPANMSPRRRGHHRKNPGCP